MVSINETLGTIGFELSTIGPAGSLWSGEMSEGWLVRNGRVAEREDALPSAFDFDWTVE